MQRRGDALGDLDRKIGIDARSVGASLGGVERYTLNLLYGLAAVEPGFRLRVLVGRKTELPPEIGSCPALERVEVAGAPRKLADQFLLAEIGRRLGLRLLHCTDALGPLRVGCRRLVTLHDVIGLACREVPPQSRKARWPRTWKSWLKIQCACSAGVVTVSAFSKSDIIRHLGITPEKIHVVHNGVRLPAVEPTMPRSLAHLKPGGRLLLHVGRRETYKNVAGLVQALGLVRAASQEPVDLVIAGAPCRHDDSLREEARLLGLQECVHFAGYVEERELAWLYEAASVFVFPSFYEGFGLPPLEAMAHGLPVVASNRASIPEVVGDAALCVDPANPRPMAEAILRVLSDPVLAGRLAQAGKARAAEFTVQEQARAHLAIYQRCLQ